MKISILRSAAWATSLALLPALVKSDCYFPNGTNRNFEDGVDYHFSPIDQTTPHSMCCRFDGSKPDTFDKRYPGLCVLNWNGPNSNLYRESCTDKTWKAPECVKLCSGGPNPIEKYDNNKTYAATDTGVTACGDGSYCCGENLSARECCNSGKGQFIVDGVATTALPSKATATPNPSLAGPVEPADTNDAADGDASNSDSGLSGGAIAGIVVGAIAGISIVALAALFLLKRSRKRRNTMNREDLNVAHYEKDGHTKAMQELETRPLNELPADEPPPHSVNGNGYQGHFSKPST